MLAHFNDCGIIIGQKHIQSLITVTSIFKNKSYQTISTHLFYKITNYSVVKIFHMYPLNTLKIK